MHSTSTTTENPYQIQRSIIMTFLVLLGFFSILGIIHYIDPYPLKNWLCLRIALQKIGLSGLFVFVLCVATMPLAAPLSLLIMAGSSAYGAPLGIVLSYVGCILNANLVYFLVRGLHLEDSWGGSRRSLRVRNAIRKNGYVLVLVFQLITIIPFMVINSAAAATGVRWRDFMKATAFGIIPSIVVFSYIGEAMLEAVFSPRFYFALVFCATMVITTAAFRKKNAQLKGKSLSQVE